MGQPGCIGSGLREEPRPALEDGLLLGRAAGAVAVCRSLRSRSPPAPPDDPAAEALSPVPQWPDNRLLIPVEGTGYLELLDKWRREADETNSRSNPRTPHPSLPRPHDGPARPPQTPSPFTPPTSPDGNKPPTGTVSPRGAQPPAGSPPARPIRCRAGPQSRNKVRPASTTISLRPRHLVACRSTAAHKPVSGTTGQRCHEATRRRSSGLQDKPASPAKRRSSSVRFTRFDSNGGPIANRPASPESGTTDRRPADHIGDDCPAPGWAAYAPGAGCVW